MNILIIDDDINISNILSISLIEAGYNAQTYNDSVSVYNDLTKLQYDLVLLDIMMPNINGYELCKKIRKNSKAPIIFISCLDDENSLLKALELGGDDYIKKPFSLSEVLARVNTHIRRYEYMINQSSEPKIYESAKFKFNTKTNIIETANSSDHLSPLESSLLKFFFEHKNSLMTYKDIYENIWHDEYLDDKSTIMARVSYLRSKIGPDYIESVRGKGYIFNIK
ncbi:MAG: response regulator transcription factor [Clostridia bacterium]|jgi:DNA-binding response OmpR family regulator|nr:response regulator transcription factor [Clostridia bacterium]